MLRKQLTTTAEKIANNKYNHNQTDKATLWDQWLEQLQQQPKLISLSASASPQSDERARAIFSPASLSTPAGTLARREESCKTRRGSAARCCVRYARRVKKMIRRFSGWAAISPSSATAGAITEMDERRSGRHRRGWRFRRRGCENAAFWTRNNESVEIRKCCFALTQCHERITLWKIQRKNEPLCPARRVIMGQELCFEP